MDSITCNNDEYAIVDDTPMAVEARVRELFLYLIHSSDGIRYSLSDIRLAQVYLLEDLYNWCSHGEVSETLTKQVQSVYLRARCHRGRAIHSPVRIWDTVKMDCATGTIVLMDSIGLVIDELTCGTSGEEGTSMKSRITSLRERGIITRKDCRLIDSLIQANRSASEFIDVEEPDTDSLLGWMSLYSKLVRALFS